MKRITETNKKTDKIDKKNLKVKVFLYLACVVPESDLRFSWISISSGVRKRSFKKGVSSGTYIVFPGTFLLIQNRKGTFQGTSTPNVFLSERSNLKRLFLERSDKECDERSLHRAPGSCSQVRPFSLAEPKKDTPRNFCMKPLIRNAFRTPNFCWIWGIQSHRSNLHIPLFTLMPPSDDLYILT